MFARSTRIRTLTVVGLGCAIAVPAAAAQKPTKPTKPAPGPTAPAPGTAALTLDAAPALLTFTQTTSLRGRLSGSTAAGTVVRLESDSVPPLGDAFITTGKTATTTKNGNYAFVDAPGVNTQYRVVTTTGTKLTSPVRQVRVRPLVGLTVSTTIPRRGTLVTFSGSVRPVHSTLLVSIQRRTSTGRYATVAKTALKPASAQRSSYSRRVRIRASGVYRVILPAHNDNVTGISRARTLTVR